MNRIEGQTVLVTGASAGIGEACARAFAEQGTRLVLAARRKERLEKLAGELRADHGSEVLTFGVDVGNRSQVEAFRDEVTEAGWMPDILVNNAGKAVGLDYIHEGDPDDWDDMIDTNVKGLLYMSRAFIPHMVEQDHGHVVNIGSIAGRWAYPKGTVYCGSKFAVVGISEGMNMDLLGTGVRVSSVDPGFAETEFSEVRFHGDEERAAAVYEGMRPLKAEDVADVVCYVANQPEHVNLFHTVVMPTDQRHCMLIHRPGK